jgi:hypothetical protein
MHYTSNIMQASQTAGGGTLLAAWSGRHTPISALPSMGVLDHMQLIAALLQACMMLPACCMNYKAPNPERAVRMHMYAAMQG